jgi:integrase/recombinase XerD
MIVLYRRHRKDCGYTSRHERRCRCPIYAEGSVGGEYLKKSLDLTSWEAAQANVREWEAAGTLKAKAPVSIASAFDQFIADCVNRDLAEPTISKYRLLKKQINDFAEQHGYRVIGDLDIEALRKLRGAWNYNPQTSHKQVERLRTFFRFCHESGWVQQNPARLLRPPVMEQKPTLPFTDAEQQKILASATSPRIKAFIEVLLYTGLRIGDACLLKTDRVQDGQLFLYTAKTGQPVRIPLPPPTLKLLEIIRPKGGYFFIFRDSTRMESVADRWRDILKIVFKAAGIPKAHPHQFRDTFAVNLLKQAVPLETVSILLGHASIKVTEKHYAPWVKERQDLLTEAVKKLWQKPKEKLIRVK